LFNLPPAPVLGQSATVDETTEETEDHIEENKQMLVALDTAMDKIDAALPTVRDLEASDKEMDDIAALAQSTFTDLIDLAMNVEARFSGPILQSASTLLGHAVTAKMAKMDKKLKMVDLQLKKAKLDQVAANQTPVDKAVEGQGMILDRNELIRSLLNNNASEHK
jgi:hypothetical protein